MELNGYVPGTITCGWCGVVVDCMPMDPMSPMNGYLDTYVNHEGAVSIDRRTGWVFHKCNIKAILEKRTSGN